MPPAIPSPMAKCRSVRAAGPKSVPAPRLWIARAATIGPSAMPRKVASSMNIENGVSAASASSSQIMLASRLDRSQSRPRIRTVTSA